MAISYPTFDSDHHPFPLSPRHLLRMCTTPHPLPGPRSFLRLPLRGLDTGVLPMSPMDHQALRPIFFAALLATSSLAIGPLSLSRMNDELRILSSASAEAAWGVSEGGPRAQIARRAAARLAEGRSRWREGWCDALGAWRSQGPARGIEPGAVGWRRMPYLLCRGPRYTTEEIRNLSSTLGSLQEIYVTARVCTTSRPRRCYRGEPDLERLVRATRDPGILLWAWEGWRKAVGPPALRIYPQLIELQNAGAQRNGYPDAGAAWRETDIEADGLEAMIEELYQQVAPLYKMLHALVRARLIELHGEGTHGLRWNGPIPAHLLGSLWGQSWDGLLDVVLGKAYKRPSIDISASLKARNVTIKGMAHLAEDLYVSLGLPPMTDNFWKKSLFQPANPSTSCHGSAANMFSHNDFRMILCATVSAEDFYVIHHEMGHIEYYMAYQHQPTIFQDGASPAFQEAVGDAIMLAATTPQHLQRIGLIDDWKLGSMDIVLLLRQALSKLAQLPFSLVVDKWRWAVFRGEVHPRDYNKAWWSLRKLYQGLDAPLPERQDDFDAATKFHIMDNTPYARYFLGGILQMQIFNALCNAAVSMPRPQEGGLPVPQLHRCDIYGSKEAGHLLRNDVVTVLAERFYNQIVPVLLGHLKRVNILGNSGTPDWGKMMALGSSLPWPATMKSITGYSTYNASSILQYFQPLKRWMERTILRENIPVGW